MGSNEPSNKVMIGAAVFVAIVIFILFMAIMNSDLLSGGGLGSFWEWLGFDPNNDSGQFFKKMTEEIAEDGATE